MGLKKEMLYYQNELQRTNLHLWST